MICVACGKKIRWYHKTGYNTSWHWSCTEAYKKGFTDERKFTEEQLRRVGIDITPFEIYLALNVGYPGILLDEIAKHEAAIKTGKPCWPTCKLCIVAGLETRVKGIKNEVIPPLKLQVEEAKRKLTQLFFRIKKKAAPTSLTEAAEKARGGPAPINRRGYA